MKGEGKREIGRKRWNRKEKTEREGKDRRRRKIQKKKEKTKREEI
jgi:hypothetical protein